MISKFIMNIHTIMKLATKFHGILDKLFTCVKINTGKIKLT